MGGYGSGPRVRSERTVVESCQALDINRLCRTGAGDGQARFIIWESRGRPVASAHYRLSGESLLVMMVATDRKTGRRELELQVVETTTTPCHFGGERRWLLCPGRVEELRKLGAHNFIGSDGGCGRRVSKLYRPPGRKQFLCRHCLDLRYRSQRETEELRLARRALAIRRKLGQRDPEQPFPQKPPGMHLRTYLKLKAECEVYETAGTLVSMRRLGVLDPDMLTPLGGGNL